MRAVRHLPETLLEYQTATSAFPFASSREAHGLQDPRPRSGSQQTAGCRGQISGWKARATFIPPQFVVHSCPFVVQNAPQLETAHSMPPESAGSRSPGWRCRGVGVASTGPAQPFIACGVLILLNCRHTLCCTAEWWRREFGGRQVGVAVHGSGVSRVPAQLGFTRRRWCGPPLGLQPQYAGQCEGQG